MLIQLDPDGNDFLEWRYAPGATAEIVDIKVRSERVRGKGRKMVQEMLRQIQAGQSRTPVRLVYALARTNNGLAHGFYTALGFVELCRIPRFYPDENPAAEQATMWGLYL